MKKLRLSQIKPQVSFLMDASGLRGQEDRVKLPQSGVAKASLVPQTPVSESPAEIALDTGQTKAQMNLSGPQLCSRH